MRTVSSATNLSPESITSQEVQILRAIRDLSFGVVEVVVHDHRVTEIRQTRRTRLTDQPASPKISDQASGGF